MVLITCSSLNLALGIKQRPPLPHIQLPPLPTQVLPFLANSHCEGTLNHKVGIAMLEETGKGGSVG